MKVVLFSMQKAYEKQVSKLIDILKSDLFRPLVSLLERHGLLTDRYNFLLPDSTVFKMKPLLNSGINTVDLVFASWIKDC